MNTPSEKGGGSGDGGQPPPLPDPSAGVRLEVAILSDQPAAAPVPTPIEVPAGLTVLVVAAESDVRCYVRECLRDRVDVRVLEAASVNEATTIAAHDRPALLVVDAPEKDVLVALPEVRGIVIVDNVPHRPRGSGARIRFLARPFTADKLVAEVGRLLT